MLKAGHAGVASTNGGGPTACQRSACGANGSDRLAAGADACSPDERRPAAESGIAVEAQGRALKVHAGDTPHLVSLGSDRFSTAVTLHPIPKGRITVGSSSSADIFIYGTGVEEVHCWIENSNGVVVVYPNGENVPVQVDGLKVNHPTRLTQGCMLCLGRSNFFRFNHPQEARYMKSVLPNTRVSMMPNAFCPKNEDPTSAGESTDMSNPASPAIDLITPPGSVEAVPEKSVEQGILDTRIEMAGLLSTSDEVSVSESKLSSDSRRSYDSPDSWCEISSGTSSEDLLNGGGSSPRNELSLPLAKHLSPKVFLPGSSTLNSPASVVLGRHKFPGNATAGPNGPFYNSVSVYEDKVDRRPDGGPDQKLLNGHDRNNNSNGCLKSEAGDDKNGGARFSSSSESLSPKQRIVPPSPAFNRNPSYFNAAKCSSPTSDYSTAFSGSPLFSSSPRFSNGSATPSRPEKNGFSSPSGSYDSVGSLSENGFRKADSELKRKQAHQNRILEQERERVERLRLEEILTACADYEKQAQCDRFNKPQIRIKTNGSLPRDKQGLSPLSKTPESPKNGLVFTFDKNDLSTLNSENYSNGEKASYMNSPRTRIKTVASPKVTRKDYAFEILENKMAILNEYESSTLSRSSSRIPVLNQPHSGSYQQPNSGTAATTTPYHCKSKSEDAHSRSTCSDGGNQWPKENGATSTPSSLTLDSKMLKKYEFLGVNPPAATSFPDPASGQSAKPDPMSRSYHESLVREHDRNGSIDSGLMSTSLINFDSSNSALENSNFSSDDYAKSKSRSFSKIDDLKPRAEVDESRNDGIEKLNGLVSELNEIVKSGFGNEEAATKRARSKKFILPLDESPRGHTSQESKFILPLEEINIVLRRQQFRVKKGELKKLQNEQSRLLDAINNVKSKLLDIQQQKDEIIRELEMEKALLEGELKSENDKLSSQEEFLNSTIERANKCEKQIDICSKQQNERQDHNKSIVNEQQNILNVLQSNLSCIKNETDKASIIESIDKSKEILEEESKSFEDFEFRLLEEKASLLSKRDELQTELTKVNNEVELTRSRIAGLYSQKEQLLQNASDEIKSLEIQVRCHTRTLQQNHARLQDIGVQLKNTLKSLNDISEDPNESCDEATYAHKTQSQEDLDRISRVTSGAPIMETGCTNSLGRRTIASLQQIERNRQLHLAQQGGHVIEEERKRMLALKRRVQDEVIAQWEEERKQRENNCNSITSIGSDNSSIMSSDRVTESPSSDDKLPTKVITENGFIAENGNATIIKSVTQKSEKDEDRNKSRRPSNAVANTKENDALVKLRRRSSGPNALRPYSVYRRQSLDLRQHIESAGHQVDHCPHVFVDKTSCRGYLQKMTTKFRSWNKRWFVFDRKKCSFTYYSDKSEKKLKGGAYFQGLVDLCIDKSNSTRSPNPQATFVVKSTERVYYLLAPSIEAMRIWFDVLATEVETYQDS